MRHVEPRGAQQEERSQQHRVSLPGQGTALAAERPGEFVDFVLAELPLGSEMICIEGEILRHRSVSDLLLRGLKARGVRPWVIAAQRPSPSRALLSRVRAAIRGTLVVGPDRSGAWRCAIGRDNGLKPESRAATVSRSETVRPPGAGYAERRRRLSLRATQDREER